MKKIEDNYFLDVDDYMLSLLEAEASKAISSLIIGINAKREQAYKLLNVLVLGVGSVFLLLTQNSQIIEIKVPLILFGLIWLICIYILIFNCIKSKSKPIEGNAPLNLYTEQYKNSNNKNKSSVIRRLYLETLQLSYDKLLKQNNKLADWLDRVTLAAGTAPAITIIIFFFL